MIRMRIRAVLEKKKLRVFFQDEARFGRINDPRACWAELGIRPKAHKQIIREYTYAYGAFCPKDGKMDSLILPSMDGTCMGLFLREIGRRYKKDLVLMVMDGAPCHNRGGKFILPGNIEVLQLPPYSPQLNPSENMWDEIREKYFVNESFTSMDHLEAHLVSSLAHYEQNPKTVQSITGWKWIIS
jgi:DDE superfamily endonuclease